MTNPINRTCPACPAGNGIPKAVTAIRRMIQLMLTCNECRHAWTVEWPDLPSALSPSIPAQSQDADAP
jgi:hypothetical protein